MEYIVHDTKFDESDWIKEESETDSDFEIVNGTLVKYHGKRFQVVIPSSVTNIGAKAFYKHSDLESVTIPDSVTSIGNYAFYNCGRLTSIVIPDNVTNIGNYAFSGCTGLKSITIGDSVTSIGKYAFYACMNLTNIIIPEGVTSIGDDAFEGCYRLTSVVIPDSVTSIGKWAFCNCDGLTSVTIPDSVTSIGYEAFCDCTKLANVEILNPELFNEIVSNPNESFIGTPWAEKVQSDLLKENKMKKIRENQKITLTIDQIKQLIKENKEHELALRAARGGKFNFEELLPKEKLDDLYNEDYTEILRTVNPKWDAEIEQWLDEEQEIEGRQIDVDDWDVWFIEPRTIIDDEEAYDMLYDVLRSWDKTDENGMVDVADIADKWLDVLETKFYEADVDEIEKYGRLKHKGTMSHGGYYPF